MQCFVLILVILLSINSFQAEKRYHKRQRGWDKKKPKPPTPKPSIPPIKHECPIGAIFMWFGPTENIPCLFLLIAYQ